MRDAARGAAMSSTTDRGNWAEASLAAVLYHTTHDLRSPLSAILNYVELLEEDAGGGTPPDPALLERLRRSTTNALAWLDALTPLARLGRVSLRSELVDLDRLALSATEPHSGKRGDGQAAGRLGAVQGDPRILERILADLAAWLRRSADPAYEGETALLGTLRREESTTDGEAEFSVEIGSLGLPPERADEIFLPFTSAGRGTAQRQDSALAAVAWGVYRHGGRIWIERSGARLRFSLPTSPPV